MDISLHLALSFSFSVFISIHLFLSYSSFFLNRYKVRITLFLLFKLYPSVSFLYVLITLFHFCLSLFLFSYISCVSPFISLISPFVSLSPFLSYLLLFLFLPLSLCLSPNPRTCCNQSNWSIRGLVICNQVTGWGTSFTSFQYSLFLSCSHPLFLYFFYLSLCSVFQKLDLIISFSLLFSVLFIEK